MDLLYRLAFAAAQREILIQNPYLRPDPEVIELLGKAADRGVDVRIMVPGEVTDDADRAARRPPSLRHAAQARRADLRVPATLIHQKVIIVDGKWSHIGSTNLDNRSFESNDEVSLGVVDRAIAAELKAAFEDDLKSAEEIQLEDWKARALRHKLRDAPSYRLNEFI